MTDEKALAVHESSALDVYGDGKDIKKLAQRIRLCLPNGNRLHDSEALSLAQLSIAYNLNPFNGEVWWIPGSGPMVGIKGHRKAARTQALYWTEHILLTQSERAELAIPDDAIAYKCLVYRSDMIRQSAESVKLMFDAGMKDAAERYAYKPSVGIGYWKVGEKTKMKPDQAARKRAEAEALKVAFDLPFATEVGNGNRVGYADAEEWDIAPVQTESSPEVDSETGEIIDGDWDQELFDAGEDEPEPEAVPFAGAMTTPKELYDTVKETIGYYKSIPHMLMTLQKIAKDKSIKWPTNDPAWYADALAQLADYARANQAQEAIKELADQKAMEL